MNEKRAPVGWLNSGEKIAHFLAGTLAGIGLSLGVIFAKDYNSTSHLNFETPEDVPGETYMGKRSFYTYDWDGDGDKESLWTPRETLIYSQDSTRTKEGDTALYMANKVFEHKNYFARMHTDKEIYRTCRVDDFDGDGSADMISWVHHGGMPIYKAPFPKSVQQKADEVVRYERHIREYIDFRISEISLETK